MARSEDRDGNAVGIRESGTSGTKEKGESRLCVDFRKLNQVTERVHFPLPNIDEYLARIRDSF